MMRIAILVFVAAGVLLGGCGGEDPAPLGSVENPAPGRSEAPGAETAPKEAAEPGYAALLSQQKGKPRSRFSPCNLVSRDEAGRFMREAVRAPVEAPQGPTCVYRSEAGDQMVTIAMQAVPFARLARTVRDDQRLELARHTAVCGTTGQPVVLVELPRDRVLSVAAPCAVGLRFAGAALRRVS